MGILISQAEGDGQEVRTTYGPILLCDPAGPLMQYQGGDCLHIEDLNPHQVMRWRMSRWEMARLGWRCLLAALR